MAKQVYNGTTDKRIIQMKIINGQLKEEDLKSYLEGIPDVSANAEPIYTVMDREDRPAS